MRRIDKNSILYKLLARINNNNNLDLKPVFPKYQTAKYDHNYSTHATRRAMMCIYKSINNYGMRIYNVKIIYATLHISITLH